MTLAFQFIKISMLLDGCETVEEYLERDTSVKYTNIGGFIVGEVDGVAFFVYAQFCGVVEEENLSDKTAAP